MPHIRKTLKAFRENAGMMQVEVARKLGVSKSRYWMMEHGQRPVPLEYALELAQIFKCRVEDIDFFAHKVSKVDTGLLTTEVPNERVPGARV